MQREHIEKFKKIRAKKLHNQMQTKLGINISKNFDKNIERQTRQNRLNQRKQEEEYDYNMINIAKNIENRPLLFEQLEQENAKRAVEKKYKAALKRAGIYEDEIPDTK